MNYTGGDTCHKVYQRSTTIYFYCDRTTQKVNLCGTPTAIPTPAAILSGLLYSQDL